MKKRLEDELDFNSKEILSSLPFVGVSSRYLSSKKNPELFTQNHYGLVGYKTQKPKINYYQNDF